MRRPGRKSRLFVLGSSFVTLLIVSFVLTAAIYALTSSVGVAATNAGDGSGALTNATVASMQFQYDTNTPTQIASVFLSFSTSVSSVRAKFTGGSWSNACTGSGTGPWTCSWGGGTPVPTSGQTLRVVAAS